MADFEEIKNYPWVVRVVLQAGIVKERKQAEALLLLLSMVLILFTLWALFRGEELRPDPSGLPHPSTGKIQVR